MIGEYIQIDLTNLKKTCIFLPQPKGGAPAICAARLFVLWLRL